MALKELTENNLAKHFNNIKLPDTVPECLENIRSLLDGAEEWKTIVCWVDDYKQIGDSDAIVESSDDAGGAALDIAEEILEQDPAQAETVLKFLTEVTAEIKTNYESVKSSTGRRPLSNRLKGDIEETLENLEISQKNIKAGKLKPIYPIPIHNPF